MQTNEQNGQSKVGKPAEKKLYDPEANDHLDLLAGIANKDAQGLVRAHLHYGNSWKKRGGVSAFMMVCRKWDRLELYCQEHGYDIFKAMFEDDRGEGIIDDIRDIRRYFLLIEAEAKQRGIPCASAGHRDNLQETAEATERQKGVVVGGEGSCLNPPRRTVGDRDPGPSGSVSNPQGRSTTGWKGDPARDVD